MSALPTEAEMLISRIETLLDQAEPLLAGGTGDEAGFALRETQRRYLPDTVNAFLDIPPARRDAVAGSMLVEQLRLLERATAQRLAALAERAETAQKANGRFLQARFGPADALPEAPAVEVDDASAPPAMLVRRVLERLDAQSGGDAGALIARAATQLATAFPALANVHRTGFLSRGDVDAVWLDVPRRDDLLRYTLARTPQGGIEASVTRFLRGIRNKTLAVHLGEWTEGLIADLAAYVERERGARAILTRLFREK
jgi:hypothetical protein